MKLTTLLVDDERLARQELREMLGHFSNIEVTGEAQNLTEAAAFIQHNQPDIVFLDIQLRQQNGFDLLSMVTHSFHLVFVTAFDQFAIRAFEINALDYLLKPVNPKRLQGTLHKIKNASVIGNPVSTQRLNIDDPLLLNFADTSRFVQVSTIAYLSAAGDYSEIVTTEDAQSSPTRLVEKSLKEWEERLPAKHFVRIHRSTIVNINQIKSIQTLDNRTMELHLFCSTKVFAVSRRYGAKVKQQFA